MATQKNHLLSLLLTGTLCAGITACEDQGSEDTGSNDYEALELEAQPESAELWQSDHFEAVLFDALDHVDGQLSPNDTAELIEQVPLMASQSECRVKGMVIGQYIPSQDDAGGGLLTGRALSDMAIGTDAQGFSLGDLSGEWSSPQAEHGPVIEGGFINENGVSGNIHGIYSMAGFLLNRGTFDARWTAAPSLDGQNLQRTGDLRGTWRPFVQAPGGIFAGLWSECEPEELQLCPEGFEFHHGEDGWASCTTRDLKLPDAKGLAPHCADVNQGSLGFKWDLGTAQDGYECPDGAERFDNGEGRELCVWNDLALPPQDVMPACDRLYDAELGYRWRLGLPVD